MFRKIGSHSIRTKHGEFNLHAFNYGSKKQRVIILKTPTQNWETPFFLRIQFSCIHSTAFGSIDCDCAQQLDYSLEFCYKNQPGLIIYFPDEEGYGLGLSEKIKLMEREEKLGLSFISIFKNLGFKFNYENVFKIIPPLLRSLDVGLSVKLLTNSPQKVEQLKDIGLTIQSIHSIPIDETKLSKAGLLQLQEKHKKLRHWISKPKV
jgi:GTP cyclohydrolase II